MDAPNMKIVVWNPQGLNAPNGGTVVKSAVEEAGASIVCMVESKLARVTIFDICRVLGPTFDQFVALPANNTAGGIIVAWQADKVQLLRSQINIYSVTIEISILGSDPWALTTVYGPMQDALRLQFLNELRAVRAAFLGS
jgi:hypothetical protein